MKTLLNKILASTAAIVVFAWTLPAQATLVTYTVGGVAPQQFTASTTPPADAPHVLDGQGYPGDTVALQSYTGTFDLTVGTSVQKINSLFWNVNWTYGGTATDSSDSAWQNLAFSMDLSRQIQIGDASATLNQTGNLDVEWENDYLNLDAGSTTTLFYDGYEIAITPTVTPYGGSDNQGGAYSMGDQPAQDVYAQFVVTEVNDAMANAPEPSSIAALIGLGVVTCGGSVASRIRSKK